MWVINCLLALSTWVAVTKGQCSISLNKDMPKIEPLILHPQPGGSFRYPNNQGNLELLKDEEIRIVCSGKNNYFVDLGDKNTRITDTIAKCDSQTTLIVSGVSVQVGKLGCKCWPSTEQRVMGKCSGSYTKHEIGFEFGNNEFIKLIDVCYDETKIVTLYTQFDMLKEISGSRSSPPRPPFKECPEHDTCYNPQYKRDEEINTLSIILGSRQKAMEYIQRGTSNYLARGHLAANADFIYNSQKLATYYYINQAPQWQNCNAYSWFNLEEAVRAYASSTNQDLIVYTGVHQLSQLPDVNGIDQDVYLKRANDGTYTIPVPRFFWKVIYNKDTKLGIAFVEVNNPYLTQLPAGYHICGNFLNVSRWNIERRRCLWYNCEVDDLRQHNVILPPFDVVGILQ